MMTEVTMVMEMMRRRRMMMTAVVEDRVAKDVDKSPPPETVLAHEVLLFPSTAILQLVRRCRRRSVHPPFPLPFPLTKEVAAAGNTAAVPPR